MLDSELIGLLPRSGRRWPHTHATASRAVQPRLHEQRLACLDQVSHSGQVWMMIR